MAATERASKPRTPCTEAVKVREALHIDLDSWVNMYNQYFGKVNKLRFKGEPADVGDEEAIKWDKTCKEWCGKDTGKMLIANRNIPSGQSSKEPAMPRLCTEIYHYAGMEESKSWTGIIYSCRIHSKETDPFAGPNGMLVSFVGQLLDLYDDLVNYKNIPRGFAASETDITNATSSDDVTKAQGLLGIIITIARAIPPVDGSRYTIYFIVDEPGLFLGGRWDSTARYVFGALPGLRNLNHISGNAGVKIMMASNGQVPPELYNESSCLVVSKGGDGWQPNANADEPTPDKASGS